MVRIYLDEDISRDTKRALEQSGHDVVHASDIGYRSMPDPQHLKYAAETGRVLVTFNRRDFRDAHKIWVALSIWTDINTDHAGILTPWGPISNVEWADLVHEFLSRLPMQYGHPDIYNQMWEWQRQQRQWMKFGR